MSHPRSGLGRITNNEGVGLDMKRLYSVALAMFVIVGLTATAASAASVHFKKNGTPTCTISGTGTNSTSTTCTGSVAGLGGEDIVILVTVSGSAVYNCENQGGNQATGQNRVLTGPATTPTDIDSDAIKNGNLTFTTNPASLSAPTTVTGAQAGCPNPNWTGVNPQLTLTDIKLEFFQPAGTLVFTCTASNPSGLSGTVTLSCTFA
jgi:hypothetical protein